jgi:hypothetical protein
VGEKPDSPDEDSKPKGKYPYEYDIIVASGSVALELLLCVGKSSGLWLMPCSACLPNMFFSIAVRGDTMWGGLVGLMLLLYEPDEDRGGEVVAKLTPPHLADGTYSMSGCGGAQIIWGLLVVLAGTVEALYGLVV